MRFLITVLFGLYSLLSGPAFPAKKPHMSCTEVLRTTAEGLTSQQAREARVFVRTLEQLAMEMGFVLDDDPYVTALVHQRLLLADSQVRALLAHAFFTAFYGPESLKIQIPCETGTAAALDKMRQQAPLFPNKQVLFEVRLPQQPLDYVQARTFALHLRELREDYPQVVVLLYTPTQGLFSVHPVDLPNPYLESVLPNETGRSSILFPSR